MDNKQLISEKAEKAFLGSLIINPLELKNISVSADDFYFIKHRFIFEAIRSLDNPDLVTISEALTKTGHLEEVGGMAYLLALVEAAPSSANIESYSDIIKDKAQRRQMFNLANELVKGSFSDEPINSTISKITGDLTRVSRPSGGAVKIGEFVGEFYDQVIERSKDPKEIYGIPTMLKGWDKDTRGMHKGEITLIAAMPNVGKTILLTQLAYGMSQTCCGAFYEMEMNAKAVIRRVVSWLAKIPTEAMRSGYMNDHMDKFVKTAGELEKLNMFISDNTDWDTISLKSDLARLKEQYNIQWFCLDYMLLLKDNAGSSRNERIDIISRNLHDIAKDLDLAGVIVHTLNKAGYGDEIGMEHLGGTAGVSYDADNVVFMTRENDSSVVELHWKKIREAEEPQFLKLVKLAGFPAFGEYISPAQARETKLPYKDD